MQKTPSLINWTLDIIFHYKPILAIFNWKDLALKGLKTLAGHWMGVRSGTEEKACTDYQSDEDKQHSQLGSPNKTKTNKQQTKVDKHASFCFPPQTSL